MYPPVQLCSRSTWSSLWTVEIWIYNVTLKLQCKITFMFNTFVSMFWNVFLPRPSNSSVAVSLFLYTWEERSKHSTLISSDHQFHFLSWELTTCLQNEDVPFGEKRSLCRRPEEGSEVCRAHKTPAQWMLWTDSGLQLFLAACCWPLGSFSFRASSLCDHPS